MKTGNSLAVQWLGVGTFTAEGPGSIPGQGTKIPQQATWCGKKERKEGRKKEEGRRNEGRKEGGKKGRKEGREENQMGGVLDETLGQKRTLGKN